MCGVAGATAMPRRGGKSVETKGDDANRFLSEVSVVRAGSDQREQWLRPATDGRGATARVKNETCGDDVEACKQEEKNCGEVS